MEKYTIFNFGLLHLEWTNALFVLTVFSVLVFLLHFLLFKPVLRTVLNREKNQGSSEKEILQLQAEKEQTIQKTQEVEKQANLEMSLYRATQLKQTKEKLDRILNEKKMQLEKKATDKTSNKTIHTTFIFNSSTISSDKLSIFSSILLKFF